MATGESLPQLCRERFPRWAAPAVVAGRSRRARDRPGRVRRRGDRHAAAVRDAGAGVGVRHGGGVAARCWNCGGAGRTRRFELMSAAALVLVGAGVGYDICHGRAPVRRRSRRRARPRDSPARECRCSPWASSARRSCRTRSTCTRPSSRRPACRRDAARATPALVRRALRWTACSRWAPPRRQRVDDRARRRARRRDRRQRGPATCRRRTPNSRPGSAGAPPWRSPSRCCRPGFPRPASARSPATS